MSEADQENVKQNTGVDLEDLGGAAVNYLTWGKLGLKDGKLEKGAMFTALDETVGEMTGRNMQRKALMDAKDAAEEEKRAKAQQLKEEQDKAAKADLQASQAAGATQRLGANDNLGVNDPEKDFLGL